MFSCVEHMHTFAYMLSKSPLFPPYHFPLCSFSPSCTLLPALICSAFHLGRGLWVQRQRESRGRGEGGVATRGHEEREEPESPYLRWYAACTHRGHCSVEAPVISLRSVWPSFFFAPLSLPPAPWLPAAADRRFPPTAGPMAPRDSVGFSLTGCLFQWAVACECLPARVGKIWIPA